MASGAVVIIGLLTGLVGCKPVAYDPDGLPSGSDMAPHQGDDAPGVLAATPEGNPVLYPGQNLPVAQQWREWLRDPAYVESGTSSYLFFSGSPAPPISEQWTLGYVASTDGLTFGITQAVQVLKPAGAGSFDQANLRAPTVVVGAMATQHPWMMWYAADGATGLPSYVSQIGVAYSDDGATWTRQATPVIAAPGTGGNPGDYGVTDPSVFVVSSNMLWLYYAGLECSATCQYVILRAESADGLSFTAGQVALRGRAGVTAEAGGVAGPSVILKNGQYLLAYTAVQQVPTQTRASLETALASGTVGLATSSDGLSFTVVREPLVGRTQAYDSGGSFSPMIYLNSHGTGDALQLLFAASSTGDDPFYLIGRAELQ